MALDTFGEERHLLSFARVSILGSAFADGAPADVERRAEFRIPRRQSRALHMRAILVGLPERREVSSEVQFEVARNPVTDVADLGAARLRSGQGQHWEDHVI